jgi:hypothetical protein
MAVDRNGAMEREDREAVCGGGWRIEGHGLKTGEHRWPLHG